MLRLGWIVTQLAAWLAFALCFVIPAAAAARDIWASQDWQSAALGPRRLGLIGNGIALTAIVAVTSQIPGVLIAAGLLAARRLAAFTRWVAIFVLLVPPYVYAYAWSLPLLPAGVGSFALTQTSWLTRLGTHGRAIWCLTCWCAPLAGFILAIGWRNAGRPAYRLALADAGPLRGILSAAAPAMRLWLLLSMSVVAGVTLTEYAVPNLCLVQTWNTEVLAEIQASAARGRALLLAWPLLALVALLILIWVPFRRSAAALINDLTHTSIDDTLGQDSRLAQRLQLAAVMVVSLLLLSPMAVLLGWLRAPLRIVQWTPQMTATWPTAIGWAALAGCFASLIGLIALPIYETGRLQNLVRGLAFTLVLVAALSPPALIGDAFAAAYLPVPLISNHGVIVSLVTAARFAIVPSLAIALAARTLNRDAVDLAQLDRAARGERFWLVELPILAPVVAAAALIVFLLSMGEVAASQLVAPAGVGNVAVTLLNQIHFGRNDDTIAMCLHQALLVGAVAMAVLFFSRPRPKRSLFAFRTTR